MAAASALAACTGKVEITNQTSSVIRSPTNTYNVQAHVTKTGPVTSLTMKAILTGGAPVAMTSPDNMNFFADLSPNACDQVLSFSYEARFRPSANASFKTTTAPQAGGFQVPIVGAPPAGCGVASGTHVFKVNATVDAVDANPGDGVCSSGVVLNGKIPVCTLRAAVMEANAVQGVDYIEVPAGVYKLTIVEPDQPDDNEANAAIGDLDITEGVAIVGEITFDWLSKLTAEQVVIKPTTIVDGNHATRVFQIHTSLPSFKTTPDAGWTPDKIVDLKQMTIRNGKLAFENPGAAVWNKGYLRLEKVVFDHNDVNNANNGSTVSDAQGGALANFGVVDGTELYFLRNTASDGGAMLNRGSAIITKSGFFANTARGGAHAIQNEGSNGKLTLENVTLGKNGTFALPPPSGNSPIGTGGDFAIINQGGEVTLRFVSIFANKGGFWNASGAMSLTSTLAGANTFMNCAGALTTTGLASMIAPNPQVGYGPCSASTTAFTAPTTVQLAKGISPVFYTPKDAPWRNLLPLALCPTRDQRNVSRATLFTTDPQVCDSGAVEYEQDNDTDRILKATVVTF